MTTTPTFSVERLREIDRKAIHDFEIPSLILMENAGREVALAARASAGEDRGNSRVIVMAGGGNNGGDGFVAARHLYQWGFPVLVVLAANPTELKGDPAVNYRIIRHLGVEIKPFSQFKFDSPAHKKTVVVDALLGTGFKKELRSPMLDAIQAIIKTKKSNPSLVQVVAVDLPSGLDGDGPQVNRDIVQADKTVTFIGLKKAFADVRNKIYIGDIQLVDIGIPKRLIESFSG